MPEPGASKSRVDQYWEKFVGSLAGRPDVPESYYEVGYFGVVPEDAPGINPLVLDGTKTASGCPLWTYEAEGKRLPRPGDYSIITDGREEPVCVTRTREVRV